MSGRRTSLFELVLGESPRWGAVTTERLVRARAYLGDSDNTARRTCDTPDMFGNLADIPEEVLFWYPFLRPLAAWWNPL